MRLSELKRTTIFGRQPRQAPQPQWVLIVRAFRSTSDKGVGDTIERLLGMPGKVFKDLLAGFDIDCGCGNRRDTYNQLYPYEQE